MALTTDMAATYRSPRRVMRKQLAMGQREDRALMYLLLGCGIIFIAQWPRLRREAFLDDAVPFDALVGGALMAWLFLAPLLLFALAALSRVVAKLLGGQGTWYTARLALFWSLLAASPLWLLNGLVAGFIGPGLELNLTSFMSITVFLVFWGLSLVETESARVAA